jgi:hypothetical protein
MAANELYEFLKHTLEEYTLISDLVDGKLYNVLPEDEALIYQQLCLTQSSLHLPDNDDNYDASVDELQKEKFFLGEISYENLNLPPLCIDISAINAINAINGNIQYLNIINRISNNLWVKIVKENFGNNVLSPNEYNIKRRELLEVYFNTLIDELCGIREA